MPTYKISIQKNRRCRGMLWAMIISLIVVPASCKKLVNVPPPTNSIAQNNVYTNDATAISVLTALYSSMNLKSITNPIQGNGSIALYTGLSSDELTLYSGITDQVSLGYYQNALQITISPGSGFNHWAPLYNYIFKCNAAIEGLSGSIGLTPVINQQLLGEAKFMRAFYYFYLVNLFGDVPLALTTDPQTNTLLARTPQAQVYEQIIADLKEAQTLLSADYLKETLLSTSTERVRPTQWAATALLARVYLYTGDYAKAEEQATTVINNTTLYGPLPSLNNVFLKNSREAIWQLQPTAINFNTVEAQTLIIPATGPSTGTIVSNPVYLSNNLLNSFEMGDLRAKYKNWIDTITVAGTFYRFPSKYKINASNPNITAATGTANMTEYFMMLRLGEQYLIRAEARAQQNNISGAQSDLNTIRTRAGLLGTTAGDKTTLLTAILHERQVELFSEWGHRWLDLKRTGNVDAVMNVVTPQKAKGAPWKPYQQWYPLPIADIQKAPNLVQNPQY